MLKANFPFYRQPDIMSCGSTCLRMIAKYYGRQISTEKLQKLSETTREGVSIKKIADAAEQISSRSLGVKLDFQRLKEDVPLPCIIYWRQHHLVVVYKVKNDIVYVADPGYGKITFSINDFIDNWIGDNANDKTKEGIALLLEPTPRLKQTDDDDSEAKKGFSFLYQYLFRYKKFIFQLTIGLIVGSLLQLIFPFLTGVA